MEEKEIIINTSVRAFLKDLTSKLYEEEYFGFLENAEAYVNSLIDGIYTQLHKEILHHETPEELNRYGSYYVKIKSTKRTMWYVFFNKSGNRYLIEFITNNHTPQSAYLNKL